MKGPLFKPKYLSLKDPQFLWLDKKRESLKKLNVLILIMLPFRHLFSRVQPVTLGVYVPLH